jgi:hypothetical protein
MFYATNSLIVRMFLSMLAKLESRDLLKPDSEVKDLGVVMALYIKLFSEYSDGFLGDDFDISEDDLSEDEPPKKKRSKKAFSIDLNSFDAYLLAYARKHNVELRGPSNINSLVNDLEDIDLPAAKGDPWGWAAALKDYKLKNGVPSYAFRGQYRKIGGDALDITTWSSAERKKHSFDKKDPLGKKEIEALKEGLIMSLQPV